MSDKQIESGTFRHLVRGSLQLRFLLGTLIGIVFALTVTGWVLGDLFRRHVEHQFHAELTIYLDQMTAHLSTDASGALELASKPSDPLFSKPYSGLYWQIDQPNQGKNAEQYRLRSRSLWDGVLDAPSSAPADGEIHHYRMLGPNGETLTAVERIVVLEDVPGKARLGVRLLVAGDEQRIAEPVARFSGLLWLSLGLLGSALALAAIIQGAIATAPLRRLRDALGAVRAGNAQRLDGSFPAEVQPLIEELNSLLAHNAEAVERARTQAGNLAHALKTPLSVIANAVGEPDAAPEAVAALVGEQVERARRQIDYHLKRARAAAMARQRGLSTPTAPAVEAMARVMHRIHAERMLRIEVRPVADGVAPVFRGEAEDLEEMLGNLFDNACKWAQRRVEIMQSVVGEAVCIVIDDDGPGIPAAERERLRHRGERADEKMPGSGLGLAIVADLAQLYGGRLDLADSPLGGLRVCLSLPAADRRV